MKYHLIDLPYEDRSLEPVISKETLQIHYGKHEKAYMDKLNELIAGTKYEDYSLEDIIISSDGTLFNNAAQVWNHIFYFFTFSPDGRRLPQGRLFDAIKQEWGSFESFQSAFEQAGVSLFGSGWVWLCSDKEGKLVIITESNAGNPLTKGFTPLLVFDVWEHAYYIDYRNRRADHLKSLWEVIDWSIVEERYQ